MTRNMKRKLKVLEESTGKANGANEGKKTDSFIPEKKERSEEIKVASKEDREHFKHNLYRPPTNEELNELRETEDLYKNNLFRLQISYLLEEVKASNKKSSSLDDFLHSLYKFLNDLETMDKHEISNRSWLPQDVQFPMPDLPSSEIRGKFQFGKPSTIKVIGSYLLSTVTRPNHNVDLAVGLPEDCFQAKDHLNFRYHTKRAMYLTILASKLSAWNEISSVQFGRIANDPFKPILIVKPAGKAGKKFTVKLHPTIPEKIFKLARFEPLKNNIRLSWYEEKDKEESSSDFGFPTPKYNASVLYDMLYEQHLAVLHEAVSECEGMKDAICLMKVWLHQRGLSEGDSCFNGFQMSMLMAYLLRKKKISSHMSSYQIFRVTLQYLATCDWTSKGISMAVNDEKAAFPSHEDFHAVYEVVFVDTTGYLNLCAKMRKTTFYELQQHAKQAIQLLQDKTANGFEALFMKSSKFEEVYDHWFRVTDLESLAELSKIKALKPKLIDHGGDALPVAVARILPKLEKGLGKRIKTLEVKTNGNVTWKIDSSPPKSSLSDVTIGLLLNTDHAEDVLDMGPPADDPEAAEFRKFWGEKSDLRRFKDGSINEAVLWEANNKSKKRLVCKQVIEYLLQRFFKIQSLSIHYYMDQFDALIKPKYITEFSNVQKKQQESKHLSTATGEEESLAMIYAFEELCKQIRNIEGLPLDINSIQGAHPAFRLTEVFPPRKASHKVTKESKAQFLTPATDSRSPWCPALDVVLQFEGSGKWPNDIEAIQYVKAAFYINLASLLRTSCSLVAHANSQFVDVLKSGYVFRIRIFHQREINLCKQSKDSGILRKELEQMAKSLDIDMVKKPLHTTLIHNVHQRFAAYGMTTRLVKRWISSQMLCDYICDEAVELITASIFLNSAPHLPPSSHMSGFLRFLSMLSSHDWQNDPLIIDLNDSLTVEDYGEIRERFTSIRQQLPAMFIVTSYDKESSIWTKERVTPQILRRLTMLAELSREVLSKELEDPSSESYKQIFRPPLEDYNVLIELDKDELPRHYQAVDTLISIKQPKQKATTQKSMPVVQFDPAALYLNELKNAFSEVAMFFYDKLGGNVIGVVWKSQAFTPHPFKILGLKYRMPSTDSSSEKAASSQQCLVPNTAAILEDFRIIGKGLVTDVKRRTES
eukprot:Seg149.9 transcript_id=Seg149.9/GoldUCD/mRNA.D3Y31 product="Nucleolar protein 6" protein_id=Seg149.9/GoldUCD/D3Y31